METCNITSDELANTKVLSEFSEAKLYLIPRKTALGTRHSIYKEFYNTDGADFGTKLLTLYNLMSPNTKAKLLGLPIVLPLKLVTVNNENKGYLMRFVNGRTLGELLKDTNVPLEVKLKYLREVGDILNEIKNIRNAPNGLPNFFVGDLQENNIMLDYDSNKLVLIDADSLSLFGSFAPIFIRYIEENTLSANFSKKYVVSEDFNTIGRVVPNENSDLYCYNIMILNFLSGINLNTRPIEEVYNYINYLDYLEIPRGLIELFSKMLSENDNNINPSDVLEDISLEQFTMAHDEYYKSYKKRRNKY